MMQLSRRSLITGAVATIMMPTVIRAEALMPVRRIIMPDEPELNPCKLWRWHLEVLNADRGEWVRLGPEEEIPLRGRTPWYRGVYEYVGELK